MSFLKRLSASTAVFFVRLVSAFFRALGWRACRFSPTCSEYAIQAFRAYGLVAGLRLALARLSRCHPFTTGGYDPMIRIEGR